MSKTSKRKSTKPIGSAVFQDNVGDHIASVAPPVDYFFKQLIQIFENNHLHGVVLAAIEFGFKQLQNEIVRFALDGLQFSVLLGSFFHLEALPQRLQHLKDDIHRLLQELHVFRKIGILKLTRGDDVAFGKLFEGFRDFVESVRERLDVFTLERGHRNPAKEFGNLCGDLLIFAAGLGELLQRQLCAWLQNAFEGFDAGAAFLSAGLQQLEKLVVFTKKFLERNMRRSL